MTAELHIGAYVGVPLLGPHGIAVGMLCAVHESAKPSLSERDVAALRLLVQLLHDLQSRAVSAAQAVEDRDRMRRAMRAVITGNGRHAVLQPIVDVMSGRAVVAEGLTRFTATSPATLDGRTTAQWFDDADRLGMRDALELATAATVLDLLEDVVPRPVAVSVNLGPSVLLGDGLADFAEATSSRLVAEGVESDGELRAVAACGVHLVQGYLFGKPSRTPAWSGFPLP